MIATGIFNWPASERRSDRYGLIGLYSDTYEEDASATVELDQKALRAMLGQRVSISATVLVARKSGHIGDLFRGIYPSQPEVGETIDLGVGTLVMDMVEGVPVFGLRPYDGRDSDWFDPHKLYRLHDQTVAVEITQVS